MITTSVQHIEPAPVRSITGLFDTLILSGNDVVDFLQRITTNDIQITAGQAVPTLLVSDKGRIIDAVWLMHFHSGYLMAVSKGMASTVQTFLERYIIMDDVSVTDASENYSVTLDLSGNASGIQTTFHGVDASLHIEVSAPHATSITEELDAFEHWRIRNGIPRAGKEMIEAFNPLELNLWDFISFTKGCYIGQEVIARLDTYKKISRSLCLWRSDAAVREGEIILDDAKNESGRITSAVADGNGTFGLCVVRNRSAIPGNSLSVSESGSAVRIERVFSKG